MNEEQEKSQTDLTEGDEKIEKLRYINSLMREMLEFQRRMLASIGMRPVKCPDFVYEVV